MKGHAGLLNGPRSDREARPVRPAAGDGLGLRPFVDLHLYEDAVARGAGERLRCTLHGIQVRRLTAVTPTHRLLLLRLDLLTELDQPGVEVILVRIDAIARIAHNG